ncbi:PREDICTED: matrix-remodeling-associated protein 5-like [Condylura cristata]|uniref:matrix-remodeling-associated protein 5-like n=1 Tax=Condylura cristata TaxID=143302 RepID=UPI00064325AA|nr:PREDICTED: matrix-remodeling-associated protein 5-like [Condylura cristata]
MAALARERTQASAHVDARTSRRPPARRRGAGSWAAQWALGPPTPSSPRNSVGGFQFNSIQALSASSFAGLSKLELLLIHGNEIPSIPDGALRDLSSLQVLKFSYNKLRVITKQTLQGLASLLRLHVDHNRIEFIHPQAFEGLTGLRLLHLEGNRLRQLHAGTLSTFTFLDYFRLSTVRHLYLADNQLSSLPPGLLDSMPLLENLYLHGNPWACDCGLQWFSRWEAGAKALMAVANVWKQPKCPRADDRIKK